MCLVPSLLLSELVLKHLAHDVVYFDLLPRPVCEEPLNHREVGAEHLQGHEEPVCLLWPPLLGFGSVRHETEGGQLMAQSQQGQAYMGGALVDDLDLTVFVGKRHRVVPARLDYVDRRSLLDGHLAVHEHHLSLKLVLGRGRHREQSVLGVQACE